MIKRMLMLVLMSALPSAAQAGKTLWVPILMTGIDIERTVSQYKGLDGPQKGMGILLSDDCKGWKTGLYLIVGDLKVDKADVVAEVGKWKSAGVTDAYPKACEIVKSSRLDLNLPLLDVSLFQHPESVVNWSYQDALTYVVKLNDVMLALIQPKYQPDPESILEGLRIEVSALFLQTGQKALVDTNCIDPEFSAISDSLLAVGCVRGSMADQLVHGIQVYRMPSNISVLSVDNCRRPQLTGEHSLRCEKEVFSQDGSLSTYISDYPF